MNQRYGGIFGLLGLTVLFFVLQKHAPALAKLFLILGGLAALGVAVLVVSVIHLAFRKPKKTPEQQEAEMAAATLQTGRSQLTDIRALAAKLTNPEIRKVSESICGIIEKILHTLEEQPKDVSRMGRFFPDYLPALQSILTKYTRLESAGQAGGDTAEKTLSCLKDMESAIDKLYLNIFEYNKQDLSEEMAVMSRICRQDGLLEADDPLSEPSSPKTGFAPAGEAGETNRTSL